MKSINVCNVLSYYSNVGHGNAKEACTFISAWILPWNGFCLMTSKLPKSAGLKAKRAHEQWSQWNIVMHSVNYSICTCNCKVIFLKGEIL